ncbi:VWA domain-containing protein [Thaumasiovibrio subtropicus]|uniref:VWA domain-containing protein n=1 Tax=Thaumasiovibrio subtropicus TaxID=1891207 RepID=UPI000B36272D|nr:VWA domain-containing protein [Thaumasiovibrio subtropicus]
MVNFLYPLWLIGLIVAPVIYWLRQRHQQQSPLIATHLQQAHQQAKKTGLRNTKLPGLSAGWLTAGWVIAIFALSGPHWRQADAPVMQSDSARVLVMDMSLSMLGDDIKPNRASQAIFKIMDLLPTLSDGYTGVVSYAADGYVVSPLTHDTATIRSQLPNLSPAIMPLQGKNAAAGVEQAINLLTQAGYLHGDIVLITSGISEREQNAISDLLADTRYRFSAYPVSTTQGTPIFNLDGQMLTDNQGNTVVSRLVPSRLRSLSRDTGGLYMPFRNDNQDVERLSAFLMSQQQHTQEDNNASTLATQVINDGYWLVWLVAGIAMFAFRKGAIWMALLPLVLVQPQTAQAALWKNRETQAYEHLLNDEFEQAANLSDDPMLRGSALYKQGDFEAAVTAFETVGDGRADYNLANAYAQTGELEKAATLYRKVLDQQPDHQDARHNLDIVEDLLNQQAQDEQQQGNDQQQGDQQQDNPQNGDQQGEQSSKSQDTPSDNAQQDQQQGSDSQAPAGSDSNTEQPQDGAQGEQPSEPPQGDNSQTGQSQEANAENAESTQPEQQAADASEQTDSAEEDTSQQASAQQTDPSEQSDDEAEAPAASQTESGQLTEGNPVLNKLDQIPDDRATLLRNQLLLQARERPRPSSESTEW